MHSLLGINEDSIIDLFVQSLALWILKGTIGTTLNLVFKSLKLCSSLWMQKLYASECSSPWMRTHSRTAAFKLMHLKFGKKFMASDLLLAFFGMDDAHKK